MLHANMKMRQSGTSSLAMGHGLCIKKQDSQHFNFLNVQFHGVITFFNSINNCVMPIFIVKKGIKKGFL